MKFYVVDAFTNTIFNGNQAGVVILDQAYDFPDRAIMQKVAGELKHSETVFVKKVANKAYELRFFTPTEEVELCGHATLSCFTVLREEKLIEPGVFLANTLAGTLEILVENTSVWIRMVKCDFVKNLEKAEYSEIYEAYGLDITDKPEFLHPSIYKAGIADILLPVSSREKLNGVIQDKEKIIGISKKYSVVGVHMFYYNPNSETTAFCRNFAPLFGIDEESATGTSNAALTCYLHGKGLVKTNGINKFIQGETMGKPSTICSRVDGSNDIFIGGNAIISISGEFRL